MSLWEQWRPWIRQQRSLLRELILMLLAMLVVGVYFLEHFSARLEQEREVQLQALAEQTARRAAEALASDDSISINLIGRETVQLAPVAGVRFLDAADIQVGLTGVPRSELVVSVPVALPDGELAGTLTLLGDTSALPRQRLEAGFVLAVLCLLLLRVAAALIQQRLLPPPEPAEPTPTEAPAASPLATPASTQALTEPLPEGAEPLAQLRLSIVNFEHIRQRYTQAAMVEVLADYQRILDKVAGIYGGRVGQKVGDQAGLFFYQEPASRCAFSALCAGLLFLRVVRLLAPLRKQQGKPPLEFKALVTTDGDQQEAWSLCVAGVPGRLNVPEAQLAATELDVKALYQPEKAQVVTAGDHKVRLQPVEQLAHRYQNLLRTQADTLLSEEGGDDGLPSR
ncbi:MAG: hypothetical protein P1U59_15130 [Alcanivorax sp.]|jgi:hypothetical protein|uniref:hypothetical protein n=1 Tax=Alcanivorax sp. TaxID=1872427 RepID=UPI0025BC0D2E|nr:hypothetical protein [Alcanivorax sp.]MDF1725849.1 hypothetical protein [Alcanivorax sp.]